MKIKDAVAGAVVVGGVLLGAVGLAAGAAAQEFPPYDPKLPTQPNSTGRPEYVGPERGADPGSFAGTAPAGAPPKPLEPSWASGNRQVWDQTWQHWGVWMNGVFVPTY